MTPCREQGGLRARVEGLANFRPSSRNALAELVRQLVSCQRRKTLTFALFGAEFIRGATFAHLGLPGVQPEERDGFISRIVRVRERWPPGGTKQVALSLHSFAFFVCTKYAPSALLHRTTRAPPVKATVYTHHRLLK